MTARRPATGTDASRPVRWLVDGYALLLALYLVLRALTGDALWPVVAGHWVAAVAWFLALALLPLAPRPSVPQASVQIQSRISGGSSRCSRE